MMFSRWGRELQARRNRKHLKMLSKYLRNHVSPEQFDTRDFVKKHTVDSYVLYSEVYDTVSSNGIEQDKSSLTACAVGWGAIAGIGYHLGESSYFYDWERYLERVYGVEVFSKQFRFLFSAGWYTIDNTPIGAANRIDWYLNHDSNASYLKQFEWGPTQSQAMYDWQMRYGVTLL